MQLNLDIHETVAGNLVVKELAYEQGYYDEVIPFKQSVSITVVERHTSSTSDIIKAFIHNHIIPSVSNTFKIVYDGWYDITHIILPTLSWVKQQTDLPETLYASDGKSVFVVHKGEVVETTIDKLLADTKLGTHSIGLVQKSIFTLFNLWQCYFNYCKRMLESECSKDSACSNGCDDEATRNRNLIWIFLNALRYYVHFGELQAAQELLENLSGCNTLCSNEMFTKLYDCGCGK